MVKKKKKNVFETAAGGRRKLLEPKLGSNQTATHRYDG